MSIDLTVSGDHAAIYKLAEWLSPTLDTPVIDADVELVAIWSDSQSYWTGLSGDAFRGAVKTIREHSGPLPSYLQDVSEVMRAYANRLQRGQEDFDAALIQAKEAHLKVAGKIVLPPTTWLQYCPTDAAPANETKEWDSYVGKVAAYNTLSTYVGTWWGDLEEWLAEHLAPLAARIDDLAPLDGLLAGLKVGNEDIVETAFEYASARGERDLRDYRAGAQAMQSDAEKFAAGLRSGNPALRAAALEANPRELRAGLRVLNEAIESVAKYSKVIPVVGGVVEVVAAGVDIANGGSPTSVAAGLGGGLGAGAIAGGLLAGGPPGWVALGVGVAGVAGGAFGTWLWEAAVPLDARETIDDFFTGGDLTLVSEPTGTWAVGTK